MRNKLVLNIALSKPWGGGRAYFVSIKMFGKHKVKACSDQERSILRDTSFRDIGTAFQRSRRFAASHVLIHIAVANLVCNPIDHAEDMSRNACLRLSTRAFKLSTFLTII